MSKDNENVPLPILTSDVSTADGAKPFASEQMVACKSCLRTNPPTRVNCLYCGAGLPAIKATIDLQKPELRPLESWEQGYNNILRLSAATGPSDQTIALAAELLKLEAGTLSRLMSANHAIPLARSSTRDEANLVQRRLASYGIETEIVPDVNLTGSVGPFRVRAAEINDRNIKLYDRQSSEPVDLLWSDVVLVVTGRLIVQRLESREEKARRKENRILDASEFFTDETIFDFYTTSNRPFRVLAKSFDFSCLGSQKGLVAEKNMWTLLALFREKVSGAVWDDSYNAVRKPLEAVWPSGRTEQSAGWRRDRPGKLSKGNVTEISNESQFQKYSSLCHFLTMRGYIKPDEES